MAVKTPEIADQIADYEFKPEDLDPDKVLLCLPGWRVEKYNTLTRTWYFKEPSDRLWVEINSGEGGGRNQATISRFGQGRIEDRIHVFDLRLVLAQVRPLTFCLGLYSPDSSYYLTMNRTESPFVPEYTISVWAGRNPRKVPSWTDRLPFRSHNPNPGSHITIEIPRVK